VQSGGSRVGLQGLDFRVPDTGFWIQSSGSRTFRDLDSEFRIQDSGIRVPDSEFRIQSSGSTVPDSGFHIQGSGFRVLSS